MLDFRMLTFLQLCETRNYTKTAEILNITQPAVSQHIKYLENYYHTKFFCYNEKRQLEITPQGLLLQNYANNAYANAQRVRDRLAKPLSTPPTLTIGSMPSMGAEMLPRAISQYLIVHDANISICYDDSPQLLHMLQSGEIDIAIVNNSLPVTDFTSKILFRDRTICICSKDHPLAEKEVSIEDLYTQRLLLGYRNSDYNHNLDMLFKVNNFDLSRFTHYLELGHATAIKNQLSCMESIAFMYSIIFHAELKTGQLKQIYVKNFQSSHIIYFCYLKHALLAREYDQFYDSFQYYLNTQFL